MSSKQQHVFIALRTILLSCEHGGNEIPAAYLPYFKDQDHLLASHRGWDIGALDVAKAISSALQVKLHAATLSRLLIELNRSLHHPSLFSSLTKGLPKQEKERIIASNYLPYRTEVLRDIEEQLAKGSEVIHISVHSFTPVLNGEVRNADIGLLYDPSRSGEKKFCKEWKQELLKYSGFKIRFNYPYKGTADGFTTYLRKKFPEQYIGLELELNQALLTDENKKAAVISVLSRSLEYFKI